MELLESLSIQLKTVETINDIDNIESAISKSISATNESLKHDSIASWNKITGKTVASNIISTDLKTMINETSLEALTFAIEEGN